MNWQPINRAIQIQQRLQPGGVGAGTHCTEGDSFTFSHVRSLLGTANDLVEDLNFEVTKNNSQKLSSLLENVNKLEYSKSGQSDEGLVYSEMYTNGNDFLDITISNGKIELLDVVDRININDVEILVAKNIEGTDVYSIELKEEDHYIYLYSTMDYEDLLQIVD